jgi:hypothetical protein
MWMDGNEFTDNGPWTNRRYLDRAMVPGVASFVAPNLDWAREWYTVPDSSTPADTWMEVDWIRIWAPGGGTPQEPVTSKSLTLSPMNPGTLTEATAGTGVEWSTSVNTTGITGISWQIVGPAPGYVWRGGTTAVSTTGSVTIRPRFMVTGEFVKVWETGTPTREINSGTVTIAAPSQTGRTLGISPSNPGSRAAGPWTTTVTTTGITSITWVVVNSNGNWVNAGNPVATSGSVSISPSFTTTGQFVKVFDTNNSTPVTDSGPVTII